MLWVPVIPSRCRARNKHIRMWIRGVYCRQKVLELGLMGTGIPFVPFPSNNPDEVRFDPEEYDHCERQNCVFVDLFSWTDWTRSGPCSVCEGRETRNEVFLVSSSCAEFSPACLVCV